MDDIPLKRIYYTCQIICMEEIYNNSQNKMHKRIECNEFVE